MNTLINTTFSLDFTKLYCIKKQIKKQSSGSLEMQWLAPLLTLTLTLTLVCLGHVSAYFKVWGGGQGGKE